MKLPNYGIDQSFKTNKNKKKKWHGLQNKCELYLGHSCMEVGKYFVCKAFVKVFSAFKMRCVTDTYA